MFCADYIAAFIFHGSLSLLLTKQFGLEYPARRVEEVEENTGRLFNFVKALTLGKYKKSFISIAMLFMKNEICRLVTGTRLLGFALD